jgi:hypothetical protein
MSKVKKAVFVIAVITVLNFTGIYYINKYYKTYSFAPEREEQELFAQQHAACAAFFYLQNRKEIMRSRPNKENKKTGAKMYDLHAELGLNFSPDKEKFYASVNAELEQQAIEVIKADNNNSLQNLTEIKESGCANLLSKTSSFVTQVKEQRLCQKTKN